MYVEGVTFSAKVNVVAAGAEEKTLMVRDLLVSLAFFLTGAVSGVSWTRLQEGRSERRALTISDRRSSTTIRACDGHDATLYKHVSCDRFDI